MSNTVQYAGKDLEAMAFAVKYHQWIFDLMQPFLGEHLVEVGAGTGSFSEILLGTQPASLTLVEPSAMVADLRINPRIHAAQNDQTAIRIFPNIFAEVAREIKQTQTPDSIIYVNVLEHIEDDAGELKLVRETLRENGRVFVFVPALTGLYSEFDQQIGHFRRYTKTELASKCQAAGFKILSLRYFDFLGIFPWWLKYTMLKSRTMEPQAVNLYDNLIVPIARPFEAALPLPIGKNLLLIAEKR